MYVYVWASLSHMHHNYKYKLPKYNKNYKDLAEIQQIRDRSCRVVADISWSGALDFLTSLNLL